MGERKILARFEKRNILDSNDPVFDIIIQQNEIVTTKYGGDALALINGSGQAL
jgi:hypothetical protein